MKSKILVDGNCIVCDKEVSHYKRMAPELFEIVDISAPDFLAANYGLTPQAVQDAMHVFTPSGELVQGVDAFAHIWSRLNRYKLAARFIKLPFIYSVAKAGYWVFAKNRHLLPKKAVR